MFGQLWFLNYMQLTTKFGSSFCARFLCWLVSVAVGLCWCKSSRGFCNHIFGRCCSMKCSSSHQWPLHCYKAMVHPFLLPGTPSPFIARCVPLITWLSDTERFGCSACSVEAGRPSVAMCSQIKYFGLCKQSSGR